jgi:hypothetical protein
MVVGGLVWVKVTPDDIACVRVNVDVDGGSVIVDTMLSVVVHVVSGPESVMVCASEYVVYVKVKSDLAWVVVDVDAGTVKLSVTGKVLVSKEKTVETKVSADAVIVLIDVSTSCAVENKDSVMVTVRGGWKALLVTVSVLVKRNVLVYSEIEESQ